MKVCCRAEVFVFLRKSGWSFRKMSYLALSKTPTKEAFEGPVAVQQFERTHRGTTPYRGIAMNLSGTLV